MMNNNYITISGNVYSKMEEEFIKRHHKFEVKGNQCSSSLVKHVEAPIHLRRGTNDVVLQISSPENCTPMAEAAASFTSPKNLESLARVRVTTTTPISSPAREIASASPAPNKPLKIPIDNKLTPRKSLARSAFSKPKSRFVEPSYQKEVKMVEENNTQILNPRLSSPYRNSPTTASPNNKANKSAPITPKTPLISPRLEEEDNDEVYKTTNLKVNQKQLKKMEDFALG
ncbi:putative F-box associated ubiquitination effector family protein [Hibiscus syriacus]|uniref:F-box associated ubiquitination effector family protein n=1 Tax=Hibiscus syriacus TaxID=106335 RepID=A0A6A3B9X8_HIBSY|nr:putative F-box associated ubiquitination effector family protein [Hibiscus syriacus]